MKILITGGDGYIGQRLTQLLVDRLHNVIVIDNLMYGQPTQTYFHGPPIERYKMDVTRSEYLHLLKYADVVICLAALVGAPLCNKFPAQAQAVNYDAVATLCKALRRRQLLIYPNSNSGYGTVTDGVVTEETPMNSLSLYGKLKDDAEKFVLENHQNTICFRLATVFGLSPRPRLDLLINNLVYRAYFDRKIELYEPETMRNYVHIDDVCSAFCYAFETDNINLREAYNLGNDSVNCSKQTLVDTIRKYIDFDYEIVPGKDPDQRNYTVSSQKLMNTGWKPTYDLDSGIQQILEFYKTLPVDKEEREAATKYMRNY